MKLYVDLGNSLIKWGTLHETHNRCHSKTMTPELQLVSDSHKLMLERWLVLVKNKRWLTDEIENKALSAVIVSSVSQNKNLTLLQNYIQQLYGINCVIQGTEKSWQNLSNGYDRPEQMGVDRWLAMIAAWHKFHQACLVVDCGTAITLDAIDAQGQHLGGHIVPGFQLLQKNLIAATARVKLHPDKKSGEDLKAVYGDGTSEAVRLGTQFMIEDYLLNRWRQFHKVQQNGLLLVTGGDGLKASTLLAKTDCYHKDLVLQGLCIRHQ